MPSVGSWNTHGLWGSDTPNWHFSPYDRIKSRDRICPGLTSTIHRSLVHIRFEGPTFTCPGSRGMLENRDIIPFLPFLGILW